jgi:hypothetical protein
MVQLAHVVLALALAAGAYVLFFRTKADSTSSSPAAAAFVNGAGAKGANSAAGEVVDTGRDFVAALKLSVRRARVGGVGFPFSRASRATTGQRSPTRARAGMGLGDAGLMQE